MKNSLAHIINPVKVPKSSELYTAQPITFASMEAAARHSHPEVPVQLYTTQFAEDHPIIPPIFQKLPDLERAVNDLKTFKNPRKLPLIGDIMQRLFEHSEAEYLLYTNVDIGLLPHFYERIKELIDAGHDAIIVNRRRISKKYTRVEDLPAIYRDQGKPHPGFDCFVIHRSLYPKFHFGQICVGIPFIGVAFAHNIFCYADKPVLVDTEHLTFHIGMQIMGNWDKDYYWHNRREFDRIKKTYWWPHFDIGKFPYARLPVIQRYWKWATNPSLFTLMNFRLDMRRLVNKSG